MQDDGFHSGQLSQPRLTHRDSKVVVQHRAEPIGPGAWVAQHENRPISIGRKTTDPDRQPMAGSHTEVRERKTRQPQHRTHPQEVSPGRGFRALATLLIKGLGYACREIGHRRVVVPPKRMSWTTMTEIFWRALRRLRSVMESIGEVVIRRACSSPPKRGAQTTSNQVGLRTTAVWITGRTFCATPRTPKIA